MFVDPVLLLEVEDGLLADGFVLVGIIESKQNGFSLWLPLLVFRYPYLGGSENWRYA